MAKFKRPCLICGSLSFNSHCDVHAAAIKLQRDQRRDTPERRAKKKALYGGDYRKRRASALANATHCHLCNKPFQGYDQVESDHLIPGDPNSPLLPAHRLCNQQRGNKPL